MGHRYHRQWWAWSPARCTAQSHGFAPLGQSILKLKQVAGCEHRDLEKIIVLVIAGVVAPGILAAICVLTEFIFQVQGLVLVDEQFQAIDEALHEFHIKKATIVHDGRWKGKNGPIPYFKILKLECDKLWNTSVHRCSTHLELETIRNEMFGRNGSGSNELIMGSEGFWQPVMTHRRT